MFWFMWKKLAGSFRLDLLKSPADRRRQLAPHLGITQVFHIAPRGKKGSIAASMGLIHVGLSAASRIIPVMPSAPVRSQSKLIHPHRRKSIPSHSYTSTAIIAVTASIAAVSRSPAQWAGRSRHRRLGQHRAALGWRRPKINYPRRRRASSRHWTRGPTRIATLKRIHAERSRCGRKIVPGASTSRAPLRGGPRRAARAAAISACGVDRR